MAASSPLTQARPVLPDRFYYLNNFQAVLDWLEDRYADVLGAADLGFIRCFRTQPRPARALLTRMAMRRSTLFRESSLRYEEIGDTVTALAPLVEAGWVEADAELDLAELFRVLRKPELAALFALPPALARLPKPQWLAWLAPGAAQGRRASQWGAPERIHRLSCAALCERLRLTYFGNFRQDWSDFVLADLGVFRFERIDCGRDARAFQTTRQVEVFQALYRCRENLHEQVPPREVLAQLPPAIEDSGWLERRRQKLLFRIAQRFESQREPEAALELYSQCRWPGTSLRRALLEERAQRPGAARALCESGLALRREGAHHHSLRRVLARIARREGAPPASRSMTRIATQTVELPPPSTPIRVEQAMIAHLQAESPDSRVEWVENALLNSLFGLLCWEAIFAPLPGAFFHPHHHGPADLGEDDFVQRREHLFSRCLDTLESGAYASLIRDRFRDRQAVQSPFVAWAAIDESLLELALACIPAAHLRIVFQWMLRDLPGHCAGFPDLVQFWPSGRRYRMVEIKGPGDRLQENQRRLLEHCVAQGLPVSVLNVRWRDPPADAAAGSAHP
ncbi:MAG: VRR-NUC domain-containing protein [Steroidobacteraceae bacterium]